MESKIEEFILKRLVIKCVPFYVFLYLLTASFGYAISAVTYSLGGGRLGDKLVSVCHAKWISYKYNIPFLYTPFNYSDQFTMAVNERRASDPEFASHRQVILKDKDIVVDPTANILYVVPYFAETHFEAWVCPRCFTIDWNDRGFVEELRRFIKPRFQVTSPEIPSGYISVAVHVRKGTGIDDPNTGQWAPHKLPPDSYYIDQLKRIADMFSGTALFVYIFTDHDRPLDLVNRYKAAANKDNLTFACREAGNAYDRNVLDDFFGFSKFDCLIRPESNFSIVGSKLKDYKVQISPYHATMLNGSQIIDQVKIEIKKEQVTFIEIV